eukprot:TRINITY_DN5553_c0_g1_i1.p2 TRINITY_DN5553_c0_g1~~TRINITY_DN5553_c0_g1_i1.p2  ORF type:complete len:364 (+),score=71.64 TRINITY_DN5553_c0_g1_i1:28-1092(+)
MEALPVRRKRKPDAMSSESEDMPDLENSVNGTESVHQNGIESDRKGAGKEEEDEPRNRHSSSSSRPTPAELKNSKYEKERAEISKSGKKLLTSLGYQLEKLQQDLSVNDEKYQQRKVTLKRKLKEKKQRIAAGPERASKRIRGEGALTEADIREEVKKHKQMKAAARQAAQEESTYSDKLWKGRVNLGRFRANIGNIPPKNISLPLTLGSIQTTIESLGTIKRGPDEDLYWSKQKKHRYPIGWKSSKLYNGKMYHMEIKEGPPGKGPLFEVKEGENGPTYFGPTPTKPWTDICIKSRSSGTRVSGPLFFGFSDPITLQLIEDLETDGDAQNSTEEKSEPMVLDNESGAEEEIAE